MNIASGGWVDWILALAIMGLTLPYLIFVLVMVAIPDIERLTNPTLRGRNPGDCVSGGAFRLWYRS